jgi:predicted transcriptional regulator
VKTTKHRLQTVHQVGVIHWVVARPAPFGMWAVAEIRGATSVVHHTYGRRDDAEAHAEALAATRNPTGVTR